MTDQSAEFMLVTTGGLDHFVRIESIDFIRDSENGTAVIQSGGQLIQTDMNFRNMIESLGHIDWGSRAKMIAEARGQ